MEITKAKITKENTLVATYLDADKNTVTVEGKNLVHGDLKAAFKALTGHMAILCELREAKEESAPQELNDLNTVEVTGYSIGGTDDDEGVTLIGKRFLKSKKVLNLIAPFTKFANENEEYPYSYELMGAINLCGYEVEQYLTAKKWAIVQQELPFDEDAPKDIAPDPVEDAFKTEVGNFLKGVAEQTGAKVVMDVTIPTKRPRRNKKKEIA